MFGGRKLEAGQNATQKIDIKLCDPSDNRGLTVSSSRKRLNSGGFNSVKLKRTKDAYKYEILLFQLCVCVFKSLLPTLKIYAGVCRDPGRKGEAILSGILNRRSLMQGISILEEKKMIGS